MPKRTAATSIAAKKIRRSLSSKAGLIFPTSRIRRHLKRSSHTSLFRQSVGAAVYTTAVLEYVAAELLELAGNAAKAFKAKILKPRHLMLAIRQDEELFKLCKDVILPSSGVMPTLPEFHSHAKAAKTITSVSKKTSASKKPTPKSTTKKVTSSIQPSTTLPAVLGERTLFLGQKLTVVKTDILNVPADAIVHPTGNSFYTGGQVGQALSLAGGAEFTTIMNSLRSAHSTLVIGDVIISEAGSLPFKHIVHVNSGAWRDPNPLQTLETVVKKTLQVCDANDLLSVAFPSIGSGRAGYPKQAAAETILRTINSYFASVMQSSLKQIYFVLYDEESVEVYKTELTRLA